MSTSLRRGFLIAIATLLATQAVVGSDAAAGTNAPEEEPRDDDTPSPEPSEDRDEELPRLALPPRPDDALGGRAVLEQLEGADLDELERAVLSEIRSGNVPASLRKLTAVDLPATPGAPTRIWVTTDYLAVGSDDDFVRVPLRAAAAEHLAEDLDAMLPSKAVVNAVVAEAEVRLPPLPVIPHPSTLWLAQTFAHDAALDSLAERFGAEPGRLVVGHMKDVVITPALALRPDKIAIYGMHGIQGGAVQPLSTFHVKGYVDYSQGIRLVARKATVDGDQVDLAEILADEDRCAPLSPEGPIQLPVYR